MFDGGRGTPFYTTLVLMAMNDTILPLFHSPLGDMSPTWLNLCRTKITDLTSLAGLSLSHLDLHRTRTTDMRPLNRRISSTWYLSLSARAQSAYLFPIRLHRAPGGSIFSGI